MAFKLLHLLILFVIQVLLPSFIFSNSVSSSSSVSSSVSASASASATALSGSSGKFFKRDPKNPNGTIIHKTITQIKMCKDSHCFYRVRIHKPSHSGEEGNGQNKNKNQGQGRGELSGKGNAVGHENYTYDIDHMPMPNEILKNKGRHMYHRHVKEEFLDAHNQARLFFKEKPFTWKNSLARTAEKWADKLSVPCKHIEHSHGPYGENIFLGRGRRWRATDAVQDWADERFAYNAKSFTCVGNKMCGHFTQIIWRSSHEMGCARKWCQYQRGVVIVCNYDPPGNYIGENPFEN